MKELMEKLAITDNAFNKLTEKELGCFALVSVSEDGTDQYISDWNSILDVALEYVMKKTKEDFKTIDLSKYTNVELLDMYYELNSNLNGNNHEILFAKLSDGIPKINKLIFA